MRSTRRSIATASLVALGLAAPVVGLSPAGAKGVDVAPGGPTRALGFTQVVTPVTGTGAHGALLAASRRRGAVVPMAKPPVTLPAALDVRPGYAAQNSCDPTDKPGSIKYAQMLKSIYPKGSYGLSRTCLESGPSEHKDGRAVDFMINANDPEQKRIGDAIVAWITANNGEVARRLGVMYLIWNKQIWGVYAAEDGWQPYEGDSPHTDHIHTSLTWDGAMGRTSWWTGVALKGWDMGPCAPYAGTWATIYTGPRWGGCPAASTPPKTSHATVVLNSTGADVKAAQTLMGAAATGTFSYSFWTTVRNYQANKGLPVTGVMDQATWAALDPASLKDATTTKTPTK